jgi:acetyltransferase-like isoleucine patch superfamily enzyme
MRSLFNWILLKKNAVQYKIRAIVNYRFFKTFKIVIGSNVIIKRFKGKHYFGRNIIIFDNSIFEVHSNDASISLGDNCFLSFGVIIVCTNKIEMGNNVWIGEYTSIRDATHVFSANTIIGSQQDIALPIKIGNNVWIGRGCLILPGTVIEDNVVIAANSVVKGNCAANSIYGGCPAKFIKAVN